MKKNIIIIIINTIILFGTVGIVGNLSVFVCNPATAFSLALVKIANPSAMLNEAKATFSVNNKLLVIMVIYKWLNIFIVNIISL